MQSMQIPAMNGYSQLGTSLSESLFSHFAPSFVERGNAERPDKAFQGNYLDVPGGTAGSPGSMGGGSFGSSFAACGRRHESAMATDAMPGRCYWPESELLIKIKILINVTLTRSHKAIQFVEYMRSCGSHGIHRSISFTFFCSLEKKSRFL